MPLYNPHSLSSTHAYSSSVHEDSCSALTARFPRAVVLTTFGCLGSDLKKQVFTHFLFPDAKMRTSFQGTTAKDIFQDCCEKGVDGKGKEVQRTSSDPCWKADDADGKFCQKNSDLKDNAEKEPWKTENINPLIAKFNKGPNLRERTPSGWINKELKTWGRDMTWEEVKQEKGEASLRRFSEQAFEKQQEAIILDFAKKYLHCDGETRFPDHCKNQDQPCFPAPATSETKINDSTCHVKEGQPCTHQHCETATVCPSGGRKPTECEEGKKCMTQGGISTCRTR